MVAAYSLGLFVHFLVTVFDALVTSIDFLDACVESSGLVSCPKSRNLKVQLQCSLNMLEGDTG